MVAALSCQLLNAILLAAALSCQLFNTLTLAVLLTHAKVNGSQLRSFIGSQDRQMSYRS